MVSPSQLCVNSADHTVWTKADCAVALGAAYQVRRFLATCDSVLALGFSTKGRGHVTKLCTARRSREALDSFPLRHLALCDASIGVKLRISSIHSASRGLTCVVPKLKASLNHTIFPLSRFVVAISGSHFASAATSRSPIWYT